MAFVNLQAARRATVGITYSELPQIESQKMMHRCSINPNGQDNTVLVYPGGYYLNFDKRLVISLKHAGCLPLILEMGGFLTFMAVYPRTKDDYRSKNPTFRDLDIQAYMDCNPLVSLGDIRRASIVRMMMPEPYPDNARYLADFLRESLGVPEVSQLDVSMRALYPDVHANDIFQHYDVLMLNRSLGLFPTGELEPMVGLEF